MTSAAPLPVPLPSALAALPVLLDRFGAQPPALFLDYDGTLSPIVSDPAAATLDPTTRAVVVRLAQVCPVAIVSGRDRADVREKVGVAGLYYAGSHGFDITGPDDAPVDADRGRAFLASLDAAEAAMNSALADFDGVTVERKRYAIALHFRNATAQVGEQVVVIAQAHADSDPLLRTSGGKMIAEVRPEMEWDKGHAVLRLLDAVGPQRLPVYIGDDVTDEDAFLAIADRGIGIHVGDGPTAAAYRLSDPVEVATFLGALADGLEA